MMRHLILPAALLLPFLGFGQCTLDIVIEYSRPPEPDAQVHVVVCNNMNSFESEEASVVMNVGAAAPVTRVQVPDLKPGTYAIKCYIDVNKNGRLDIGWNNTPTEPYGFSLNVGRLTGLPTYDMASFTVHEGTNVQRIHMH
jgi:uncharacterized protein (DUF2141 family)